MAICLRPSCNKPLNTGTTYCSTNCSNKDRGRMKALNSIPTQVKKVIGDVAGDQALVVLDAMAEVVELARKEEAIKFDPNKAMKPVRTLGDWYLNWNGDEEWRPEDTLDFEKIKAMDTSGVVQFAFRMRQAQLMQVFKPGNWGTASPDQELANEYEANLKQVLEPMMYGLLDNGLRTGAGICEIPWENKTKWQLGLSKNKQQKTVTVMGQARHVDTETVVAFRRDGKGRFNGFKQDPKISRVAVYPVKGSAKSFEEIKVERENSLVITFQERNRNKWGISLYKAMYPLWFWYQIILRSMVRYMERMGTPVTVVDAPADKTVIKPGTTDEVDAMVLGLQIAANAAKSNALVVPSNVDPKTGNPMWGIRYLTAQERAQPFVDVLEKLSIMILRAAFFADRSLTGGEIGAFNLGEIHQAANSLYDQMVIMTIVHQFNEHISPRFAQFNRGINAPPLYLAVIGIDIKQRDLLFKLLGVGGNIPSAQEAMARIDWVEMASAVGAPTISEEEREKQRKKMEEEALGRQKKQIEMQKEAGMSAGSEPFKDKAGGMPKKEAEEQAKKNGKAKDSAELIDQLIGALLENNLIMPIMVSEEEQIDLFNPFRDALGRFASGSGRGGGKGKGRGKRRGGKSKSEALSKEQRDDVIAEARNNPGKFSKTTSRLLKLGAVAGSVGLIAIASRRDDPYLADIGEGVVNAANNIGVTIPIDELALKYGFLPSIIRGRYAPFSNKLIMNKDLKARLEAGDPLAIHTLIHELAHSAQETGPTAKGPSDETLDEYKNMDSRSRHHYKRNAEYHNELVSLMIESQMAGEPITDERLRERGEAWAREMGYEDEEPGHASFYADGAMEWARLAMAVNDNDPAKASDWVIAVHDDLRPSFQRDTLISLFPEKMASYGKEKIPSTSVITQWMEDSYDTMDGNSAMLAILNHSAGR